MWGTRQLEDRADVCRIDFSIIRKNAAAIGLKAVSLGVVRYVAVVPEALMRRKKKVTLRDFLATMPLATQTTDGQFTSGLREIAKGLEVSLAPALACQSFPQTMAAVRSGRFAAVVPEMAVHDLPVGVAHLIHDPLLGHLDREAMLAWNPRLVRIRPNASKIAMRLHQSLRI